MKACASLQILSVGRHPIVYGYGGFNRRVWRDHIERGAAGSDGSIEDAHRLDPQAIHRRDGGVAKEIVDHLLLRATAQPVYS